MTGDKTNGGVGQASVTVQVIAGGRSRTWEKFWELMRNVKWDDIARRARRDFCDAEAVMYGSLVRAFDITTAMQPGDLCCGGGGNWGHEWNCQRLKDAPFTPLRSTVTTIQDYSGVVGPTGTLVDSLVERGMVSEAALCAPPPRHDDPVVAKLLDYYGITGGPGGQTGYSIDAPVRNWRMRDTNDTALLKYMLNHPNPIFAGTDEKNIPVMFRRGDDEVTEYLSYNEWMNHTINGHAPLRDASAISQAVYDAMQKVLDLINGIKGMDLI